MFSSSAIGHVVIVGIGATAVMDAWLALLSRLGVPTTPFALVGRWVGHLSRGRFAHAAIAKAEPVAFERGLGWLTHYARRHRLRGPAGRRSRHGLARAADVSAGPGLVGLATVAAPWFVMQPAMGSRRHGVSKTPAPLSNSLRNLANHAVFGTGLYLAAAVCTLAASGDGPARPLISPHPLGILEFLS
jgi:hypothetical protein